MTTAVHTGAVCRGSQEEKKKERTALGLLLFFVRYCFYLSFDLGSLTTCAAGAIDHTVVGAAVTVYRMCSSLKQTGEEHSLFFSPPESNNQVSMMQQQQQQQSSSIIGVSTE